MTLGPETWLVEEAEVNGSIKTKNMNKIPGVKSREKVALLLDMIGVKPEEKSKKAEKITANLVLKEASRS